MKRNKLTRAEAMALFVEATEHEIREAVERIVERRSMCAYAKFIFPFMREHDLHLVPNFPNGFSFVDRTGREVSRYTTNRLELEQEDAESELEELAVYTPEKMRRATVGDEADELEELLVHDVIYRLPGSLAEGMNWLSGKGTHEEDSCPT